MLQRRSNTGRRVAPGENGLGTPSKQYQQHSTTLNSSLRE